MIVFKNSEEAEEKLNSVPLPEKEKRYVPISHNFLIENISTVFELSGHIIKEKKYKADMDGKIMSANFLFEGTPGSKSKPLLFFQNSYNKMVPVKMAVGLYEDDGSNLLIKDFRFSRKHTGTVKQELITGINELSAQFNDLTEKHIERIKVYKILKLNKEEIIELTGKIIYNDILNLRMIPKLMKRIKETFEETLVINGWEFISLASNALRTLSSRQELTKKLEFYKLIQNEFKIY